MSSPRVYFRETPETRFASGQVVRNPGLRADRGFNFCSVKVFSLLIFRALRDCQSSSKLEEKEMAKDYKTEIKSHTNPALA